MLFGFTDKDVFMLTISVDFVDALKVDSLVCVTMKNSYLASTQLKLFLE